MAGISKKQREVIDQNLRKNADAFVGSAAFRAIQADIEKFGNEAFDKFESPRLSWRPVGLSHAAAVAA